MHDARDEEDRRLLGAGDHSALVRSYYFNRNRINVATSRAQCRVELHCSPRLLEADCKTVEHMRLANALCRSSSSAASRSD